MTGRMISRYKVLGRLGAGGMGEVYRAMDTKMQREVAIKLLLPQSAQDPERLQRFKHEALATSSLNHPNITTIYEIDEADGKTFISLEYIVGRSLRELLRQGELDLHRSLEIAAQVADGLHAAHEAGVVHRDLKPENVMVRPDGIAKILDFGLAKLASTPELPKDADETLVQSPGATLTQPGMVLGTVAYMSPEQARGQELDRRSDLFTFGGILLEMLTGKQPFQAESSIETMHAIIHEQPQPLHEIGAPSELLRILRKCLAKRPDERYQSAKDLAIDLRALQRDIDSGATTAMHAAVSGAVPQVPARRFSAWIAAIAAGAILIALVLAFFARRQSQAPRSSPPTAMLQMRKITNTGEATEPRFNPSGQYVAYMSTENHRTSIRIRQISTGSEVEVVPAKENINLGNLAFTPDGSWLLYTSRPRTGAMNTLWQISPLGGTPREVMRDVDSAPSFLPDGKHYLFRRNNSVREATIYMATLDSAEDLQEVYKTPPEALAIGDPVLSPDGSEIVYVQIDRDDVLHPKLMVKNLKSPEARTVPGPRWMQLSGYDWGREDVLYVAGSRTWAERSQIWMVNTGTGESRPVTQGFDEHSHVSMRNDGKALATVRTTVASQLWHVPMDGSPAENGTRAQQITRGTDMVGSPQVAPDGRLAYVAEINGSLDIWVADSRGENARQITFDKAQDFWPVWSPDGQRLAFASEQEGDLQIWVADADGQNRRQLTQRGSTNYGPSWSPDGNWLAYIESRGDSSFLCKIPLEGGDPVRLSREQQVSVSTQWSPDGKTIAAWVQPTVPSPQFPITLFPADGEGEARQIPFFVRSRYTLLGMHWLPDGSGLSLAQRGEDGWQIQTQPVDGDEARPLVVFPGEEVLFNYCWSPEGSSLVAQRGTVQSDILMLEDLP